MTRSSKPKTNPPEQLSEIERKRIKKWCSEKFPMYQHRLAYMWDECHDHHQAEGRQFASWEAAFRTWIRKAYKFEQERRQRDRPQQSGPRSDRFVSVGKVIEIIDGGKKT